MSSPSSGSRGVLLLHYEPRALGYRTATTVAEHVDAFRRHSRFDVWTLNTHLSPPPGLAEIDFAAIVLHYSLFEPTDYHLGGGFRELVDGSDAFKVAFFQDEHHHCQDRFRFVDDAGVDLVYTLLEPSEYDKVWRRYTHVPELRTTLPGYVDEGLLDAARRFSVPDAERAIDVGYRGRPLAPYMGREAQEKTAIGWRFRDLAAGSGLVLDIGLGEEDRLYGDDWYRFVASCRGMLGVEAGVSTFDLDDRVLRDYERRLADGREVTLAALEAGPLADVEGKVYYRTVSPRHFEAAAFGVCQILFEGRYSGVMEPGVHYIPLRKDFSNIADVIDRFKDPAARQELTDRTHRDLIDSGAYSYERFIAEFDDVLIDAGLDPDMAPSRRSAVDRVVRRGRRLRLLRSRIGKDLRYVADRAYQAVISTRPGAVLIRVLDRLRGRTPRHGEAEASR